MGSARSVKIDKPFVFRRTVAGSFSAVAAGLTGALCALMLVVATVALTGGQFGVGTVLLAVAAIMLVLLRYVLRDALGKLGWRIGIATASLDLDLPPTRSLIHNLAGVHIGLGFDEIERIETRLEAYRTFGMANMNKSYALLLKTGQRIILGEDRALGTQMGSAFLATVAARISKTAQLELRDLGMAEGKGGVLAVLFSSPPQWDAPTLDAATQQALWRRVGMTGMLASAASLLVLVVAVARFLS